MSLEDTLERPTASQAPLSDPASAWVTIGTCPQMAAMNNYPVAMQRDGLLYVVSGGDGGNTVLTSDDGGVTWNPPQTGDWPVRRALSGALHAGRFYIIGGFSPGQGFGDTLVSDDGLHFTQVGADPPPWGVRWAHTLLSTGDKLLMIAGVAGPVYSDEVWSLDAAGAWTRIAQGQFTRRAWAAGAVLGSKLLVIGGWNDTDGAFAETLVSDDGGATWTVNKAPFTPRHSASAVTIGDTVYLVGGCTGRPGTTFYNDVWATKDGVLWTQVDHSFGPIGRTFATANLAGRIGVIGSSPSIIGLAPPSLGWTELPPDPGPGYIMVPDTGQLPDGSYWAWGGGEMKVLRSDTGLTWQPVTTNLPQDRNSVAGCVHHGKLFVCGGVRGGQYLNDVYASADGITWTQVAGAQRFAGRSAHCMVSFQDKLWVFGGSLPDVWRSDDDGVSWTQTTTDGHPGGAYAITYAKGVAFKGQLWLLGGVSAQSTYSSPDGITWTKHTPSWSWRADFGAHVIGGTLYVVRGQAAPNVYRDVWASADGIAWQRLDAQAPYALQQFISVVVDGAIIQGSGVIGSGQSHHVLSYRPPQLPPA